MSKSPDEYRYLDFLPETDPVHRFAANVRDQIKSQVPALFRRDSHLPPKPRGGKWLASSAPDLNNDHLPEELQPFADDLQEELDVTDLKLLEVFHSWRLRRIDQGMEPAEATEYTRQLVIMRMIAGIEDTEEALRQADLVSAFAECYINPDSVA